MTPLHKPRHIAIIMDGNGRWAKAKGKNRTAGHRKGVESIRKVISHSAKLGIEYITLYSFSTENWTRPPREVNFLMRLFSQMLDKEVPELYKNNVRMLFTGRRSRLKKELIEKMEHAEKLTRKNDGLTLILALDYGGRQEIVDAVKEACSSGVDIDSLTVEDFRQYLYLPDVPDPDLIIRTANEMRISNFLIWQAAYSELYITETLWPDFDEKELDRAIESFSSRERKFGSIGKR